MSIYKLWKSNMNFMKFTYYPESNTIIIDGGQVLRK